VVATFASMGVVGESMGEPLNVTGVTVNVTLRRPRSSTSSARPASSRAPACRAIASDGVVYQLRAWIWS
jgi:hypothetical protein